MNILKLSQIRKPLNFKVQMGISMDIHDMIDGHYGDVMDFDVYLPTKGMNLQRPLVWSDEQKQEFVISVLKGIEVASISVIIYRDDTLNSNHTRLIKVIDGKQRITTLMSFIQNEFPLVINGDKYFYNDMEDIAKSVLRSFWFRSNRVYEYPDKLISDDDKIAWFEMINFSGTPQDVAHLNNLKKV